MIRRDNQSDYAMEQGPSKTRKVLSMSNPFGFIAVANKEGEIERERA